MVDNLTATRGEGMGDDDGDFVFDYLDCDSVPRFGDADLDHLANGRELQMCAEVGLVGCVLDPDIDDDAVIDGVEGWIVVPEDTDDGIYDVVDTDDDGDGVPTLTENGVDCPEPVRAIDPGGVGYWTWVCDVSGVVWDFGGNGLGSYPDTDDDTTPDFRDVDDDGDGIPTSEEGPDDTDCDGITNHLDPTDDGSCDTEPTTPPTTEDPVDTGVADESCGCATGSGAMGWPLVLVLGGSLARAGLRRRSHDPAVVATLEGLPER